VMCRCHQGEEGPSFKWVLSSRSSPSFGPNCSTCLLDCWRVVTIILDESHLGVGCQEAKEESSRKSAESEDLSKDAARESREVGSRVVE